MRLGAVGPAARPQLHQAAAPSLRPQLRQTTTRPGRAHGLVCRASAVVPTAEPGKTRLGFLGLGLMGRLMVSSNFGARSSLPCTCNCGHA